MKITFLNPFRTDAHDRIVTEILQRALRPGTELEVLHLEHGPRNIDYYAPKQLVQVEIIRKAVEAERNGADAFVIGCLYDPALVEVREQLSIPVIGPLETATALSRMFGHRYAILSDHEKALPMQRDILRAYGTDTNCVGLEAVGWFVDDMVSDPIKVARDTVAKVREVMARTGAETVIIGCTIVAACYEYAIMAGEIDGADLSVINPNVLALKSAEMFADLQKIGQYRISRQGYYQNIKDHDAFQAEEVEAFFARPVELVRVGATHSSTAEDGA